MKYTLTVITLLGIIFIFGAYCFLYVSLNLLDPANPVNTVYRTYVLKYPLARTLLRLHQAGDARFDYIDSRYPTIDIHLFYQNAETLHEGTKEKIMTEMKRIIPSSKNITFGTPQIIDTLPEAVNDRDLAKLIEKSPTRKWNDETIPFSIYVLSSYAPHPTYVGIVESDTTIFIFKDAIRDIAHLQVSDESTEVSTILHEFAHLLGAEHIAIDGCIMSEKVEDTTFYNLPSIITDTYCGSDVDEINRALSK